MYANAGGETKIIITRHITFVSGSVLNALMAKKFFSSRKIQQISEA
jgi:hypothetical protein